MSPELSALGELYEFVRAGRQPRITLTFDAPATKVLADALHRLGELEDRVQTLEAVRAWYADPGNYVRVPAYTQIAVDKGERARAAASGE